MVKEVELDKNGQYTISKIKGLYKLEVETEKVADATMTISVQYVLDDNAGTVVKSEKPAKMTADKGEDYVTGFTVPLPMATLWSALLSSMLPSWLTAPLP